MEFKWVNGQSAECCGREGLTSCPGSTGRSVLRLGWLLNLVSSCSWGLIGSSAFFQSLSLISLPSHLLSTPSPSLGNSFLALRGWRDGRWRYAWGQFPRNHPIFFWIFHLGFWKSKARKSLFFSYFSAIIFFFSRNELRTAGMGGKQRLSRKRNILVSVSKLQQHTKMQTPGLFIFLPKMPWADISSHTN